MSEPMDKELIKNATYLGDGAYMAFTGYDFVIFTHNGYGITNKVHLEDHVIKRINDYAGVLVERFKEAISEVKDE
jgi:hypothetical protein